MEIKHEKKSHLYLQEFFLMTANSSKEIIPFMILFILTYFIKHKISHNMKSLRKFTLSLLIYSGCRKES